MTLSPLGAGGVTSGVDVLRALALGAQAAFVGRAPLYGLVRDGQAGVSAVLRALTSELRVAMQLSGRVRVADIGPDLIWSAR
jgi:4-hydroxymandelate oxidase